MEHIRTLITNMYHYLGYDPTIVILSNTLFDYTMASTVFVLAFFLIRFIQRIVLIKLDALAKKTPTDLDDIAIKMVRSFHPPFYLLVALWFSLQFLVVHGAIRATLTTLLIVWAVYQSVIIAGIFVEEILLKKVARDKNPSTQSAILLIARLVKGIIWGIGFVLLLGNLGIDVSSLIAGLGIGGIAVAFALQGILSDLFSSFSIYFDKPFEIGDFIIVDTEMGTVERIGIKSTRLRSLSGEEVVLSNHFLTGAQIHNYKKMSERRVVFRLGVTYDTSTEKLKEGLDIIKQAIADRENARLDRVHFATFGDFALQYECVYYVVVPDYAAYMDTQEAINFFIKDGFAEAGISLAFPTSTVHLVTQR